MKAVSMTLTRTQNQEDGILGTLKGNDLGFHCVTLEHAYATLEYAHGGASNGFLPKLPTGTYTCVRGPHRLHGMTDDFTTFEITNVPGHTNILFHWGNYNRDSEGCVLLGDKMSSTDNGEAMITSSRLTFSEFMRYLDGVNEFILTVV